jgi:hypothetical protein
MVRDRGHTKAVPHDCPVSGTDAIRRRDIVPRCLVPSQRLLSAHGTFGWVVPTVDRWLGRESK